MMKRFAVGLAVLVASCTAGSPTSTATASRAPAASAPRSGPTAPASPSRANALAIVSGPNNFIALVATDGATVASATATPPSFRPNFVMSWTSASLSRLYYLNAGGEVRYLAPDGSSGTATRIAVTTDEQAGISVSPDDKRIAVSIFSYTRPTASGVGPVFPNFNGMRLYVEDLNGGGNHIDIFSSTTLAEFPIGWVGGNLVIAVGESVCCQAVPINPYAATNYHVANPVTGNRVADLCPNTSGPEGPLEPAGVVCWVPRGPSILRSWTGAALPLPASVPSPGQYLNALSPDGTKVAVGDTPQIRIISSGPDDLIPASGYVFGWLDGGHIVLQREGARSLSIVDLQTRQSVDVGSANVYLGAFPTPLS